MVMTAIHDNEWLETFCDDAVNCSCLMLCDVINYNGVIFAADSQELVELMHRL